ncbi:hypothetical protein B0T16DRAFT_395715 [Cercophora newfieldiana]|uniref:Uncharacterized protein n=1 Tax=Cercophora newfieldiana TaxID=92897 RepID=A0AA40CZI1_9PEZI|nr:hypothetical protein B0T16DRAFT_395715 [Cercophora newfieldiana]
MSKRFQGPPPSHRSPTFLKGDPLASDVPLMSPTIRNDRRSQIAARLRRLWVPDILWCLVGLGCGAAIVGVLAQYDGERPPEWPLGITLNTFLAFLATIAKASLLIPVTRGLAQLRWVWFSSAPRRADDFELFEGAAKGAFGSLRFLVSLKGGFLGFLGALIIVASIMVSTVTQGAINFKTHPFPSNNDVQVPRITVFDTDRFFMDGSDDNYHRVLNMKQHVAAGAYTPATKFIPPDPILCSTGDCHFPPIVTLGVCSSVSDISPLLRTSSPPPRSWPNMPGLPNDSTWSAALPAGQNLTIPTLFAFDFFLTLELAPSLAFSSIQNQTFANIYMLYSNVITPTPNTTDAPARVEFSAVEMAFHWCAKAYAVNVTRGVTTFTELSRSSVVLSDTTTAVNMPLNLDFILCIFELTPKKCEENTWGKLTLAPPPGFESHGPLVVDELASLSLSSFLTMSFWNGVKSPLNLASTGEMEIGTESEGMFSAFGRRLFRVQGDLSLAFAINLYRDFLGGVDPRSQVEVLRNLTGNIAGGVENFIRSDWKAHAQTAAPVEGVVFAEMAFVNIRWAWLSYLLVELVLSSLFLVGIIWWTSFTKARNLGGSALATLCALDEATRQRLGHIGDYEELRRRAARIEVRLAEGPEGLALREFSEGDIKGVK